MGRQEASLRRDAAEAARILGDYIRIMRTERQWTVAELAARIGVSAPTVSAIEKGSGTVTFAHVLNAASILGVPLFATDERGRAQLSKSSAAMVALLPARVRSSQEVNDALKF